MLLIRETLGRWLAEFERHVRARDFASGRAMFAADVVAFGTRAELVHGLDALEANQWRPTWPNITDFAFKLDQLEAGQNGNLAWAVVAWGSTGYDADGTPFDRPGRATLLFTRRDGQWLASHSHFSLAPGSPQRTFGPPGQPGKPSPRQ